jgi:D-alanyl-D-alanine-carboxypeptidase/D-alanyl-D-alanine-endopeptidase
MDGAVLPAGGMWGTPRALAAVVSGLLVDRLLGDPAPTWRTTGRVRWHNGAVRDASAFAGALTGTGDRVVVHRLGGAPEDTDALGARLLEEARQG